MLHRSVRLAFVIMAVFSLSMSFVMIRHHDDVVPLGHGYQIRVDEMGDSSSADRAYALIQQVAVERRVNIARIEWDVEDAERRRFLYLAVGDPGAPTTRWLNDGYPYFSRDATTEVRPFKQLGLTDSRGYYLMYGSKDAADEVLARLRSEGFKGAAISQLGWALETESDSALRTLTVVALAVAVLVAVGVVLNVRAYGVRRLQGQSVRDLAVGDGLQLLAFVVRLGVPLALVTASGFYAYNRLHWLTVYTLVTAAFIVPLITVALVSYSLALALVLRSSILNGIKGQLPRRGTMLGVQLVRVAAGAAALSAAATALQAGAVVATKQGADALWAGTGRNVRIVLSGTRAQDPELAFSTIGPWIRSADQEGRVILSQKLDLAALLPPTSTPQRGAALLVNEEYLARHPLPGVPKKESASAPRGDQHGVIRVLLPEKYAPQTDLFSSGIRRWLEFQVRGRQTAPRVEILSIPDHQKVFTYGSINLPDDAPFVQDVPIMIIPNGSPVLTDQTYTSFASQGGIIFSDSQYVASQVRQERFRKFILAVSPVSRDAARSYAQAMGKFKLALLNSLLGAAILAATSIGAGLIFCRRNAQHLFARYLHGWPPLRMYRRAIPFDALLALGLTIGAVVGSRQYLNSPSLGWTTSDLVTDGAALWLPMLHAFLGLALAGLSVISMAWTLRITAGKLLEENAPHLS